MHNVRKKTFRCPFNQRAIQDPVLVICCICASWPSGPSSFHQFLRSRLCSCPCSVFVIWMVKKLTPLSLFLYLTNNSFQALHQIISFNAHSTVCHRILPRHHHLPLLLHFRHPRCQVAPSVQVWSVNTALVGLARCRVRM